MESKSVTHKDYIMYGYKLVLIQIPLLQYCEINTVKFTYNKPSNNDKPR